VFAIKNSYEKIVEENHNLIYAFLNKCHLPTNEYYDLAAIGLCKAAKTWDCNKQKFCTYAYTCMFNEVMGEKRKYRCQKRIESNNLVSLDAYIDTEHDVSLLDIVSNSYSVEDEIIAKIDVNSFVKSLKDRDKQVVDLFALGYCQDDIADIIGVSQATISRIKKTLKNKYIKGTY
jgi:RNA polymerase sigma factor (sigma-70 family)